MDRVFDRLEQLYAIGATRVGETPEEDAAHRLAAHLMREAGLEVETDGAGNTRGRRGDGRVWIGSHLDSVPTAGRFDGAGCRPIRTTVRTATTSRGPAARRRASGAR